MNNSKVIRDWSSSYLTDIPWNAHQLTIFKEAINNSIQVNASAGVGKTTQIVGLVGALNSNSIQILAFNKHIAEQLKQDDRLKRPSSNPNKVKVNTVHSLCYGLLIKRLSNLTIKEDRTRSLINTYLENAEGKHFYDHVYSLLKYNPSELSKSKKRVVREYINGFRNLCVDLDNFLRLNLLIPCYENIYLVIYKYSLSLGLYENDLPFINKCLKYISQLRKATYSNGELDYTELLELAIESSISVPKYDYLIVDEAQDSSPLMLELYRKYTSKGSKVIFLGDEKQSIFGFAGADPYIWSDITKSFNVKQLPLNYCYRCPTSHLELVDTLLDISMLPGNSNKGKVHKDFDIKFLCSNVREGDLVIARYNFPLINIALKLVTNGKKVYIKCSDIPSSIFRFLSCSLNYSELDIEKEYSDKEYKEIIDNLYTFNVECIARDEEPSNNKLIFTTNKNILDDYYNCCMSIINSFKYISSSDRISAFGIRSYIEELCKPSKDSIVISSIHRAKGAEANNVWLITPEPDYILSAIGKYKDSVQEFNLLYVALTRAKKNLYISSYNHLLNTCVKLNSYKSIVNNLSEWTKDITREEIAQYGIIEADINITKQELIKLISKKIGSQNRGGKLLEVALMSEMLYNILEVKNPGVIEVFNSFDIKIVFSNLTHTFYCPGSILLFPIDQVPRGINLSLSKYTYPEDLLTLCL